MSNLLRLNKQDFIKGAVSAVVAGVACSLYKVFGAPDFNIFLVDWAALFNASLNAGVYAFVGYLGKNFMSDSEGKFLGRIG